MTGFMDRQQEQYYNTKQCTGAKKNKLKC